MGFKPFVFMKGEADEQRTFGTVRLNQQEKERS